MFGVGGMVSDIQEDNRAMISMSWWAGRWLGSKLLGTVSVGAGVQNPSPIKDERRSDRLYVPHMGDEDGSQVEMEGLTAWQAAS